jgi:Protein of unknown function (DUF2865)
VKHRTPRLNVLTVLRRRAVTALFVCATVVAGGLSSVPDVHAQGWWPWSNENSAPRPREPVYRPNQPPPAPMPGQPVPYGAQPPPAPGYSQGQRPSGGSNICVQLEQRLVAERQSGGQSREQLPKIENEIRQTERALQQAQGQLERGDCYEYFLFSKSLRRTPQCLAASEQVEGGRRRIAALDGQRQQLLGSRERSYQDDMIRELARNNCGPGYVQEARRLNQSGGGLWSDEEAPAPGGGGQFGSLPFATYRTVCVRLCDGFFFPVSFSTLPNHFQRDADVCSSRCAAPVDLYYHQNPGSGMEQAQSAKNQTPYTQLKSAFRYRKEYVQGCSCKEAEYVPAAGEKRADSAPPVSAGATASVRQPGSRIP